MAILFLISSLPLYSLGSSENNRIVVYDSIQDEGKKTILNGYLISVGHDPFIELRLQTNDIRFQEWEDQKGPIEIALDLSSINTQDLAQYSGKEITIEGVLFKSIFGNPDYLARNGYPIHLKVLAISVAE